MTSLVACHIPAGESKLSLKYESLPVKNGEPDNISGNRNLLMDFVFGHPPTYNEADAIVKT